MSKKSIDWLWGSWFWLGVFAVAIAILSVALSIEIGRGHYAGNQGRPGQTETVESVVAATVTSAAIESSVPAKSSKKKKHKEIKKPKKKGKLEMDSGDEYILKKIAMAEAEDEGIKGKALVMRVVLNRVKSKGFPDSISEVVFQERQFSPISNGRYERVEPDKECQKALKWIQNAAWDESRGALYFESKSASNWHRDNLQFLFKYGGHYFYTERK